MSALQRELKVKLHFLLTSYIINVKERLHSFEGLNEKVKLHSTDILHNQCKGKVTENK